MKEFFDRLTRRGRIRQAKGTSCIILWAGVAVWSQACVSNESDTYRPYGVIGYNYTDRDVARFFVDGQGAGSSEAHESGGGGGLYCCIDLPKYAKTLHVKVELGLTREQYEKDLPNETFETDIPMPPLPNKHGGFIGFRFMTNHRVEASWVSFPTAPNGSNTH